MPSGKILKKIFISIQLIYNVASVSAIQKSVSGKNKHIFILLGGFPGGSVVKNPSANSGDEGSIPGSGRLPGEGNRNPLQYSCLGNPMEREAWWAAVCGVSKESDTTQQLNSNKQQQILFQTLFPYRSLSSAEKRPLCCKQVLKSCLFYTQWCVSVNPRFPPPYPPGSHKFVSSSVSLFLFYK